MRIVYYLNVSFNLIEINNSFKLVGFCIIRLSFAHP
jgi:hypothetical protein